MGRLAIGLCLTVALGLGTAMAEELDFPSVPDNDYSIRDLNDFVCLHDERIRVIYVDYAKTPGEPPCTVIYEKNPPEESSSQVLWRADTKHGFCEAQARDLVQKLRQANWKCGLLIDVLGSD